MLPFYMKEMTVCYSRWSKKGWEDDMDKKKNPWYDNIEKVLLLILLSVMLVILFVNVVTRFGFKYTATWSEQAVRLMFIWASFTGTSLAGMTGAHLRVTICTMVLGEKRGKKLMLAGDVLLVVFCWYLAYKIFGVMMVVFETKQTYPAIPWLPVWQQYFAGVLGIIGLSLRIIQARVRMFRSAKQNAVQTDEEVKA